MSTAPLLEADRLCVRIGAIAILSQLSFTVEAGQVLGVIGPNGAGKTTAVEVLSGFRQPTSGSALLGGESIGGRTPNQRVQLGLTRTFQESPFIHGLTAGDHVRLALSSARRIMRGPTVAEVLERVGLASHEAHPAAVLSLGERRMLDLARALACRPTVLLLDEPFAGLSGEQEALLATAIRAHTADGGGVLIIEHRLALLREATDTVIALVQGARVASGSMEEVLNHTSVRSAYLGRAD
jgi:ABC-type branched-subunit amino acid transport system ATPase component